MINTINTLNSRFKSVVLQAFTAVVVAAVLRHTLHVYAEISREDIRSDALLLICGFAIVVVTLRIFRRH